MKKLFYIFSLILMYNLSYGQLNADQQWKDNILKNNIKSQDQWNYKYVKGKPTKNGYKNYTKVFDRNGNVIEEVYYQSGSVDQKLNYKYDNNENKVEYINYKGSENKLLYKQNISYDSKMRKVKEIRFNGAEEVVIKYDYNNDRLNLITKYDSTGFPIQKRNFVYTGNICNVNITDEYGEKIGKIVNEYDNNDNIIKTTEYDKSGKIKEKYDYTFSNNLLQEKTKYAVGNFIYTENYKYDSKGNLIEIIKEQPKGKKIVSNKYKYDSRGNLIEEEWYDNNPNENSKKTYYYNDKGILEKVEVYYSLYRYKIQYRYNYTFYK